MEAYSKHKVTLSAVITRADGTVEDLGVLSELNKEEAQKVVEVLSREPEYLLGTLSEEQFKEES